MSAATVYELIGYLGSALIVVSLTRKSILKLRLFGLGGAIVFLTYALLIEAYPIALVNTVIIGIHLWFIRQLVSRKKEFFTVLHIRKEARYLQYFIDFYADEIRKYQPDFTYEPAEHQVTVFILRNAVPAGLFLGRVCDDRSLEVTLDFVTPQYRDFKAGRFLYSTRSGVFENVPCDVAWTRPGTDAHTAYLRKMGFAPAQRDGVAVYQRSIAELHVPPPRGGSIPYAVRDG